MQDLSMLNVYSNTSYDFYKGEINVIEYGNSPKGAYYLPPFLGDRSKGLS
jgi:hypothetical protein